jgi:hypothetical protein
LAVGAAAVQATHPGTISHTQNTHKSTHIHTHAHTPPPRKTAKPSTLAEATAVIGQWLPCDDAGAVAEVARAARALYLDAAAFALSEVLPAVQRDRAGVHAAAAALRGAIAAARSLGWTRGGAAGAGGEPGAAAPRPSLPAVAAAAAACDALLASAPDARLPGAARLALRRLRARAERLRRSVEEARRRGEEGLAFEWVDSELVRALRAGDWVSRWDSGVGTEGWWVAGTGGCST